MLHTRFTDALNLDYPIMSAPMSNHSGARLATAVSLAGGLGTFGGTNDLGPEWLREQMAHIRNQTGRPFGVGFITQLIEYNTTNIEIALEERVPVFIFSFADPDPVGGPAPRTPEPSPSARCSPWSWRAWRSTPVPTCCSPKATRPAATPARPTSCPSWSTSSNAIPTCQCSPPGASPPAAPCRESSPPVPKAPPWARRSSPRPKPWRSPTHSRNELCVSDGQDTTFTRLYDLLGTRPWPDRIAGRVYRNRLVREWDGRDTEILAHREELASDVAAARANNDTELSAVYMGQGAGHINAIQPAPDVLRDICQAAEEILQALPDRISTPN